MSESKKGEGISGSAGKPSFSRWRALFWPIYSYELKKVIPMGLIFFCILFVYTTVRNVKDALVVTAAGSGAEALVILKTFFVTPVAILFVLLYTKMSNLLNRQNLFYATLTPFLAFFVLFGFVLYPAREWLHPSLETVQALQLDFPRLKWFFAIYGSWTYAVFYILAELWGSVLLSMAFWQFANQITRLSESKRFYSVFGLLGQFALIFSGQAVEYFSDIRSSVPEGVDPWGISLRWLMGAVLLCGVICLVTYRWMHTSVLTDTRFYDASEAGKGTKKAKLKLSFLESLKVIATSPYLLLIAILIIAYGSSINLVEGIWKSQIKQLYPVSNDYNAFMGRFAKYTGWATLIMMIVGGNILRVFSWFVGAVATPAFILVSGFCFYVLLFFRETLAASFADMGLSPLQLVVFFGAMTVIGSKAVKYALFDLTKEMAYIPLDEEMKVKGKAVVDVVGGRLGKACGAGYQTMLLTLVPGATYMVLLPFIGSGFLVICVLWIISVKLLSKRVDAVQKGS